MTRPYVVGVTGGIGSGKSTVCALFERFDVPVVDADLVAREVVVPGSEGLAALRATFGTEILNADGTLDRDRLRSKVFADADALRQLEELLHPMIRARIAALLEAATAPYCLLCVPLLVEKGGYDWVDRILVIDCERAVQISRVMQRDDLTAADVDAIMQTQATRAQRLAAADDVIANNDVPDALGSQVESLHRRYLQLAAKNSPPASH